MDLDDEPSPWQLEQLVCSSSDIDHEPSEGQGENDFWHSSKANLVFDAEYFPVKLRQLLHTVREDDPLLQTTQHKPCIPIEEGESGSTAAEHTPPPPPPLPDPTISVNFFLPPFPLY